MPDPTPTTPTSRPSRRAPAPPRPATFQLASALRTVRILALRFGPREAASPAYAEAADWVEQRFDAYGYDVRRQPVHVPAGNSWGIDVDSGTTTNVVATRRASTRPSRIWWSAPTSTPCRRHREPRTTRRASAVLLELARMAAQDGTRLPVVFVAFGGEEPRGDGDALHHFGSRAMVARMPADQRAAVRGDGLDGPRGRRAPWSPSARPGRQPPAVRGRAAPQPVSGPASRRLPA